MVTALRELFAKSKHPSHDDKESAAQTIASLLEQAQEIGRAHASEEPHERGHAWGITPQTQPTEKKHHHPILATVALAAAWNIVTHFVSRVADWIAGQDAESLSEDDIIAEVDSLAETVASVEVPSAIEGAVMEELQNQDFLTIAWIAQPGACELCLANAAASPLPIGSEWPSGDTIPPAHPHCRCSIGTPASEGE